MKAKRKDNTKYFKEYRAKEKNKKKYNEYMAKYMKEHYKRIQNAV